MTPGIAAHAHYMQHVELQQMPHKVNIRHRGEDWAGITNRKERKKLQNRLNKRVSRQRKRTNVYHRASPDTASPDVIPTQNCQSYTTTVSPLNDPVTTFGYCTEENIAQKRALLKQFAEQALTSYKTADPCADHRLKLIQLNVVNGFTRNAAALGFKFDWLICECISPFGRDARDHKLGTPSTISLPGSLMPTSMQLRTRHHPWLDLFPLPKMRDNLLLATNVISAEDEQLLFDDIMESGGGRSEWAGLVVWGEPWDPRSWEISVPFLQRWGWLLRGCPEIITSTNYWRSQRDESPIEKPDFIHEQHEYDSRGTRT
ncbi:hypothetical protein J7T55_003417 [Diaporthe amygdali]|uniref:uncharacterized protein n=1 Tax=Phomopsis amygdali TaxID=1214568 RepID=UPI0022FE25CF|nr:uncharacterized protein J7T55_003417 [Diaporthe amygdali]KAJ0117002.1 hypothetical protein J7T55_003417 [Diaporthe amygdali]